MVDTSWQTVVSNTTTEALRAEVKRLRAENARLRDTCRSLLQQQNQTDTSAQLSQELSRAEPLSQERPSSGRQSPVEPSPSESLFSEPLSTGQILVGERQNVEMRGSRGPVRWAGLDPDASLEQRVAAMMPGVLYLFCLEDNSVLLLSQPSADFFGDSDPQDLSNQGLLTFLERVHPDDRQHLMHDFQAFLDSPNHEVRVLQFRLLDQGGGWRWVQRWASVFQRDEKGVPTHIIGIMQDISAQKEAEQELKERDKFVERLTATVPGLLCVFDISKGALVFSNGAAVDMLGHSYDELLALVAQGPDSYVHPDDRMAFDRYSEDIVCAVSGEVVEAEYRFRTKEGGWLWLHAWSTPFTGSLEEGNCQILTIAQDISSVKQARTNARLQRIASMFPGAVLEIHVDPALGFLDLAYASEGLQELLDFTSEEEEVRVAFQDAVARVHEEDWGVVLACVQKARQDGEPFSLEFRWRLRTGEIRWMWFRAVPKERTETRRVWCASITDVTHRKEMQLRLVELEQRSQQILSNLPMAIMVVNGKKQEVEFLNLACQQLFGFHFNEVLTLSLWLERLFPQDSYRAYVRDALMSQFTQTRNHGVAEPLLRSARVWCKSGTTRDVDIHGLVDGERHLFVFVDVTERLQAERSNLQRREEAERLSSDMAVTMRDLNRARTRAEEAATALEESNRQLDIINRELEAFSYSVSHDLRAPLRHIRGFSTALKEACGHQLDEVGEDYLQKISKATSRMGLLIDELLELSRVTRAEMQQGQVDLSALCTQIASELVLCEPERSVQWSIEPGVVAPGDQTLLRLALYNLLENAWKYSSLELEAHICVELDIWDGKPALLIRDNGVGFDMRYAGKLFGAFQRLQQNHEFEGTGIGLATVRRIVLRHGGRVHAESQPGQGASFRCCLPGLHRKGAL